MEIKTVSYKRLKNLGNYENETIEMIAELTPGDNPAEVMKELKTYVENELFPKHKLNSQAKEVSNPF